MRKLMVTVFTALAACPAAWAADYVYSGDDVVGVINMHASSRAVVNHAALCGLDMSVVTVGRVYKEGESTITGFMNRGVQGAAGHYVVKDGYSMFSNADRWLVLELIKPGAKLRVTYETCGRSPERTVVNVYKH